MTVEKPAQEFLNNLIGMLYERAFTNAAASSSGHSGIYERKEDVSLILGAPELYEKNFALIDLLGRSRFNTNGESWRKRRDLSQPAYVAAVREPFSGAVTQIFEEAFDEIDVPSPASVSAACALASMRVFLNALGCRGDATRFVAFLEPLRALLADLQHASFGSVSASERDALESRSREAGEQFAALLCASDDTRALLEHFTARIETGRQSDAAEELLMNMFAGVETRLRFSDGLSIVSA